MREIKKSRLVFIMCACFALVAAFALAGCSGGGDEGAEAPAEDAAAAAADAAALPTITPGTLTVATGNPAYPPYVMDDAPESGKGFEAALTYAVAEKMGFSADQVVWVRTRSEERRCRERV